MYRMLFTNARASALFAGAIVLLATAFVGGQDATRPDKANLATNTEATAKTQASTETVDMGFMEDEELIQSSDGDDASPDEMASAEESGPQDTATPDETEVSDAASTEPVPDLDPSAQTDGM